jgi:hypothetical protein
MRRVVGSIVVMALGVFGFATVGESQQTGVSRAEVGRGKVRAAYTVGAPKGRRSSSRR